MSFFKKLKDRMFRSSDKIGEGLEALVAEGADTPEVEVPVTLPDEQPDPSPQEWPADAPDEAPEEPEEQPDDPPDEVPQDLPPQTRAPETRAPETTAPAAAKPGLLGRLFGRAAVDEPRRVLDDAMLESLEEVLIQADMGVETATRVTANIAEGRYGRKISTRELRQALADEVTRIMTPVARPMPLAAYRPASTTASSCSSEGISALNERQLLRSTMASMTSLTALPTLLSIKRPLQRQTFRPPFYALPKAPRQEALLTQVKNLQVAFLPQTENRVSPLAEKPIVPKETLPVRFSPQSKRPTPRRAGGGPGVVFSPRPPGWPLPPLPPLFAVAATLLIVTVELTA